MRKAYQTRSSTHTLPSNSQSQNSNVPVASSSTPAPVPSMNQDNRDTPPHMPADPALEPNPAPVPVAIWLGTREFAGVWTHGSRPRFGTDEIFGFLGDGRLAVLADAMAVYGLGPSRGVAWSPGWCRDNFVHWALNYVRPPSATINSIVRKRSPSLHQRAGPHSGYSSLGPRGPPSNLSTNHFELVGNRTTVRRGQILAHTRTSISSVLRTASS